MRVSVTDLHLLVEVPRHAGTEAAAHAPGATRSSDVMEIAQPELDDMQRRGLPLARHLRTGLDFYRTLARG